jgi:hypothetical protein
MNTVQPPHQPAKSEDPHAVGRPSSNGEFGAPRETDAVKDTGHAEKPSYAEILDALIERLTACEEQIANGHAKRASVVAEIHDLSRAHITVSDVAANRGGWSPELRAAREITAEIACALRIPENAAERLIAESRMLATDFPQSQRALESGKASYAHVQAVLNQGNTIPEAAIGDYEEQLVPLAETLTVPQLRQKAREFRERVHPETIEVRASEAIERRSVWIEQASDGMAELGAYIASVDALGIMDRLTQYAAALRTPDDNRTIGQRRSDVLVDLLINGGTDTLSAAKDGIRARVMLTVPVLSLLGQTGEPASLEGAGPIPIETARELCASAPGFTRVLTNPETGTVLSVGRDRYSIPPDLRRFLRLRDQTCRFPGCRRSPQTCEIDHTNDWNDGGDTNHSNLANLCAAHHHLKHHTKWTVSAVGNAKLIWTSVAGRTYATYPGLHIEGATHVVNRR